MTRNKLIKHGFLVLCLLLVTMAQANPKVEIDTSMGSVVVELYPDKAPKTVANFLQYVKDGFYENTIFHRVISRFMIQGGGFDSKLTEKSTRAPVSNEASNGLENLAGSIAMARTAEPDSATAQFFINLVDNPFLNHTGSEPEQMGYCVFGKVIGGMDVVKKVGLVSTMNLGRLSDVPTKPIIIKSIKLLPETASN